MPSVVCFGEALVDLLAEPSMQPGAPQRFVRYAGGAPANVAVAVARLGAPAVFVGMLAEDSFGDFLLQSLAAAGVSTQYIARTRAAHTALALVSLDAPANASSAFTGRLRRTCCSAHTISMAPVLPKLPYFTPAPTA